MNVISQTIYPYQFAFKVGDNARKIREDYRFNIGSYQRFSVFGAENNMLIDFIGIRMLLYGFVFFLLVIYTDFRILFQVPQWILLLIIGIMLEWDKVIKFIRK